MNDVLEETIYVLDMPVAMTIGSKVRRDVYATPSPAVASTVVQVQRLAFAEALVEIRVVAKAKAPARLRPSDSPSEDAPDDAGDAGAENLAEGVVECRRIERSRKRALAESATQFREPRRLCLGDRTDLVGVTSR
jgi:hypothetical protein